MAEHRDEELKRLRWGLLSAAAIVTSALAWVMFGAGTPASAEPKFLTPFPQVYPEAAASPLNGCLLCHTSPSPNDDDDGRNPYGEDWKERGDKDFRAIEDVDSDRDGFSNLLEIQSFSFPGDPSSTPLSVTTTTTQPGTPPDGAALYASSCAACHGSGGGNLRATALTAQQFAGFVTNGKGASMPAFGGSLSAEQVAAIYAYVTGAPTPAPTTTTTTVPGSPPPDGSTLFNDTCAGCHGPNGGNLVPTALGASDLVAVITNGRAPSMPAYGASLSASQIQALADYLVAQSTSPTPTTTTTTAPGTRPRSGSAVWAASCAGCHGAGGGNLVGTTLGRSQLVTVISDGTGSMAGFAARLPGAEIEAVADYLRSLAAATTTTEAGAQPDGADLFMKNCAICHGPHGEGGTGGPIAGAGLSRGEVLAIVRDGTGSMPGFGSKLGAGDLQALVDYAAALADSPSTSTTGAEGEPGEALTGLAAGDELADSSPDGQAGTATTTTSTPVAQASGIVAPLSLAEQAESGSTGSPWVPIVPLFGVAVWLGVDAVRSGQIGMRIPRGGRAG